MISFRIETPKGMNKALKKIIVRYIQVCNEKIAKKIESNIKEVFQLEGARGGHEQWKPVSEIARRFRKVDKNAPTLIDSQNLKNSIKAFVMKDPKVSFVSIGTDLSYARLHNNSDHSYKPPPENDNVRQKTYTVPKREFLFITRDDLDDVRNIFKNTPVIIRG